MSSLRFSSLVVPLGILAMSGAAAAQALPGADQFQAKYQFEKPKEEPVAAKKVEWKSSASAGFSLATGNASLLNLNGGADLSRFDGKNKIKLELNGAYGRTDIPIILDRNGNGVIDGPDEIGAEGKTTAGYILGKFRYDRFFTVNNAAFLSAYAGLDIPASKKAFFGAQAGYSRQLFKTALHELAADIGVDYNFTDLVGADTPGVNNSIHIASARVFASYGLNLGENTRFEGIVEALINLNPTKISDRYARPADATRVNAKVQLTTKIWNRLSFRFATGLRYDNCPALNSQPGLKFGALTVPDNITCSDLDTHFLNNGQAGELNLYRVRYNQKLDTQTDASLVFSFL